MFETHFVAVGKVSMLILYDIVLGHGSMVYSLGVGLKGPALVRFHVIKKKKKKKKKQQLYDIVLVNLTFPFIG